MEEILRRDFDTFTEMIGAMLFGWGDEQGPQYGAFFRASVTQLDAIVMYLDMLNVDLAPLLPRLQCPVMVGYYEGADLSNGTSVRRFAALAPRSGLRLLREQPSEGASPDLLRDVGAFLGEQWDIQTPPRPGRRAEAGIRASVRTILFTDIENHTQMMNELGDHGGRAVLREHEQITRTVLREHDGVEVKTVGDSFIASFGSATRALECATALQRAFAQRNSQAEVPLSIRIGLNAGEPIEEDDDLFGTSVIAASRIKDKARGGQIYVANVVRELVAGKQFLFADLGEQVLRGLEDPVRIYELRWD
jgi:class 3 adenylate cyclase